MTAVLWLNGFVRFENVHVTFKSSGKQDILIFRLEDAELWSLISYIPLKEHKTEQNGFKRSLCSCRCVVDSFLNAKLFIHFTTNLKVK